MPVSKKFLANSFAKFYVRREPSSRRTSSRRTLVRSGCNFFPRTNFLANRSPVRGGVRANSGEPGRTPPNSGERSAYSCERSPEFGGVSVLANRWRIRAEFARVRSSSPEFARVRASSRRTTVRRVYCPLWQVTSEYFILEYCAITTFSGQ